jgi:DNA-binding HxlR family transcriptional regulator
MPYPADYQALQESNVQIIREMRDAQREYGNIRKYSEIEQQRLQQQLNELRPKALTDPDAARRYRELTEQNGRLLQILTDPSGY